MRRRSDDLPAFGSPASAASATSLSRSSSVALVAGQAGLGEPRRLPGRRREARVAAAAAATAGDDRRVPRSREVGDELAVLVAHLRADRARRARSTRRRRRACACRGRCRRGPPRTPSGRGATRGRGAPGRRRARRRRRVRRRRRPARPSARTSRDGSSARRRRRVPSGRRSGRDRGTRGQPPRAGAVG